MKEECVFCNFAADTLLEMCEHMKKHGASWMRQYRYELQFGRVSVQCWCGERNIGGGTLWLCKHLREHGGLTAHWLESQLGVNT